MDCKICFEKYNKSCKKPFVLNCGHSMCSGCLARIKLTGSLCPTCRKPITDEKPNFDLIELLDMNLIVDPSSELRNSINKDIKGLQETKRQIILDCTNKKLEISKNVSEIKVGVEKRTTELLNQILSQQEALDNETENIRKNLNEKVDDILEYPIPILSVEYPISVGLDKMEWSELQSLKDKLNKAKKEMESNKAKISQIDACFVFKTEGNGQSSIGRISFLKSSSNLNSVSAKMMQTSNGLTVSTKK